MIISKLECEGYRNFEKICFLPESGINVIYGENAQGKTNLLEAIWLFCGAKSFRGAKDSELTGFNKNIAKLKCDFIFGEVKKNAEIIIDTKRKALLSGKQLSACNELAGKFYTIAFSPTDLNLVNGGPGQRRKFLDTAIGQIYPVYNKTLRSYVKAVDQRNSILRDLKYHRDLEPVLDDFENSLSSLIKEVIKYRLKYISIIKNFVPEIYDGISNGRETLDIQYVSKITADMNKNDISLLLNKTRKEDIITGNTSVGPHRDDIIFTLNGTNARSFGSQGQRRSIALSLKLSEAKVLKNVTGEYPVALLDDVMSELDKQRQNYILNHICEWQVFLTCCDPSNISSLDSGAVFYMKNGNIERKR